MDFHNNYSYLSTSTPRSWHTHFYVLCFLDPYIRRFVRFCLPMVFVNPFYPWVFYRLPTYRLHHPSLDNFRSTYVLYDSSRPTLPSFTHLQFLSTVSCMSEYQRKPFQALPFHLTSRNSSSPDFKSVLNLFS